MWRLKKLLYSSKSIDLAHSFYNWEKSSYCRRNAVDLPLILLLHHFLCCTRNQCCNPFVNCIRGKKDMNLNYMFTISSYYLEELNDWIIFLNNNTLIHNICVVREIKWISLQPKTKLFSTSLPGMSNIVIAVPEIKANLTCVYSRYRATPICNGKLEADCNGLNDTPSSWRKDNLPR